VKKIVISSQYPVVGSQSGGNESEVRRDIHHLPSLLSTLFSSQYPVVGIQSGGNESEVRRYIHHLSFTIYHLYSLLYTLLCALLFIL